MASFTALTTPQRQAFSNALKEYHIAHKRNESIKKTRALLSALPNVVENGSNIPSVAKEFFVKIACTSASETDDGEFLQRTITVTAFDPQLPSNYKTEEDFHERNHFLAALQILAVKNTMGGGNEVIKFKTPTVLIRRVATPTSPFFCKMEMQIDIPTRGLKLNNAGIDATLLQAYRDLKMNTILQSILSSSLETLSSVNHPYVGHRIVGDVSNSGTLVRVSISYEQKWSLPDDMNVDESDFKKQIRERFASGAA